MIPPEQVTWRTTWSDTVEVYPSPGSWSDDGTECEWCWRYRVRAANNKVVEQGSESYTRRRAAEKAAERHHPRIEAAS